MLRAFVPCWASEFSKSLDNALYTNFNCALSISGTKDISDNLLPILERTCLTALYGSSPLIAISCCKFSNTSFKNLFLNIDDVFSALGIGATCFFNSFKVVSNEIFVSGWT